MEYLGSFSPWVTDQLERFADLARSNPHGGRPVGRLVLADTHPGGLKPTIVGALGTWMAPSDFAEWRSHQAGRPVATAGKTFVAFDGVPTAVICPMPDDGSLLGLAAHEILELAHLDDHGYAGIGAADLQPAVLADEYCHERARVEIARSLDWPPSRLDSPVYLANQSADLVRAMRRMPPQGPPPNAFWDHWVNIARVWVMAVGRADAGAISERAEIERWYDSDVGVGDVYRDIQNGLQTIYAVPSLDGATRVDTARRLVWDPLIAAGQERWADS